MFTKRCTPLKSSLVGAFQDLQRQKQSPPLVRLPPTLQRCPLAEMSSWAALHLLMLICWTTLTQRLLPQLPKGQHTDRVVRPVTYLVKRHTGTCCMAHSSQGDTRGRNCVHKLLIYVHMEDLVNCTASPFASHFCIHSSSHTHAVTHVYNTHPEERCSRPIVAFAGKLQPALPIRAARRLRRSCQWRCCCTLLEQ